MLKSLKGALVSSFVGTIAIGWIFAQGILHFAFVFSAPITGWLTRREYRNLMDRSTFTSSVSIQDSVPELVKSLSLLVVGYLLLRWLYFIPEQKAMQSEPEEFPQQQRPE